MKEQYEIINYKIHALNDSLNMESDNTYSWFKTCLPIVHQC